jgi:hypothetical protein
VIQAHLGGVERERPLEAEAPRPVRAPREPVRSGEHLCHRLLLRVHGRRAGGGFFRHSLASADLFSRGL